MHCLFHRPAALALSGGPPVVTPNVRCLLQRSEEIAAEKNRALKAALNAELRKSKATLLEQAVPLLEKMARKGKGLTPEKIQARQQLVRPPAGAACLHATMLALAACRYSAGWAGMVFGL